MAISVGSVAVDVVPDTRGFATELKAKLKGVVANVKVDADLTALREKLTEATRPRSATINVDADTALAEAQIAAVAQDRTANIRANTSGLTSAASGVSALALSVATLGPALIPITAAVVGLGLALAGPIAVAGGGLTIGALIAGKAISDTKKQQKDIADLAKKVASAKLAVETATTPGGKKSAMIREAEAVKAYQAALAALTPAQKKFIDAQDRLKGSFQGLVKSAGGAIFGPVVKGMDLLAKVLPKLKPLIVGVADGIGTLLTDLSKAASGPEFKAFIKSFGSAAGDAIVGFGRIFGSVAKGLTGFFRAFGPLSKAFVGGLGDSARGFANWAQSLASSKSFQSFLAYVRDVGPKVAAALGHMFKGLGKIAAVMAPMGGLALSIVDGLSKLIIAATPAQLAAVAYGIGAIGVALLIATGGLSGIVPAILGLGTGLAFAYGHSSRFRNIVDGIGKVFTEHLLPALKDAWKTVLPGLLKGFDNIKQSIKDNQGLFMVLGDVFKGIGKVLVDKVLPAVAQFYRVYLPLLGKAIGFAITDIRTLAVVWTAMATAGLISLKLLALGALATFGTILTAADKGLGWLPGIGPKIHAAKVAFDKFRDNTVAALDAAIGKVAALRDELNNIKPKTVEIRLKVTKAQLVLNPSLAKPRILPGGQQDNGVFGAAGGIVRRPTVALIGEAGPEALVPLNQTPGNSPLPTGGLGGPQFNVEKVVAQDVNDFLRQMQTRSRLAGLGGLPA